MILSDDKISHLSHLVLQGLEKDPDVEKKGSSTDTLRLIKRIIHMEVELDDQISEIVHKKLASYSRKIIQGSPEWEVLYQKTVNEEMNKRRK